MPLSSQELAVTKLIDDTPISELQLAVFYLCTSVVFLDVVDTQIIGIVAPMISSTQHIARSLLGWIFAAGTFGATVGAFADGLLADRIGRKRVLALATVWFGLATMATVLAHGFASLITIRIATGLGLGGAVPSFVAMTSEYAPARRRAAIVRMLWAAFPLGGMFGGFADYYLLKLVDWHALFLLWGVVPLVIAVILALRLPESIRFLLARRPDDPAIRRIVDRIAPGTVKGNRRLVETQEDLPGFGLWQIFAGGQAARTVLLCIASFLVFGVLVVIAAWTPTMLTAIGFRASDAALVVAFNGLGSFVGTSASGRLMERLGPGRTLVPCFTLATAATIAYGNATGSLLEIAMASFIAGMLLGLSFSGVVALSALSYPITIRSTGVGWALGIGRFGAVVGSIAAGAMVGFQWSNSQIWLVLGGRARAAADRATQWCGRLPPGTTLSS